MDERRDDQAEDVAKELDNIEVTELDDRDLEGAAGGNESGSESGNTNCGCNGQPFSGGSGNTNCAC